MTNVDDYFDMTFSMLREYDPMARKWSDAPKVWPDGYGDWNPEGPCTHGVPKYMSGSDYSGQLVERNNCNVWSEQFADGYDVWWTEVSGGHGTYAIVVKLDSIPEDAIEFLEGLSNYPSANDDALSHLEMEAEREAWKNWAESDFRRELEKKFDVDLESSGMGRATNELFYRLADEANEYWVNEQGDSMWIDVEKVAAKCTAEDLADYIAALKAEDEGESTEVTP